MKAIIVDDELQAAEALKLLLNKYCNEVEIVAMAHSVDSAYDVIKDHKADILFLDVEMPGGSGFELLRKLGNIDLSVIFTTAYGHYAIKALKHAAIDYLLKPIDVDELREAVNRAKERKNETKPDMTQLLTELNSERLALSLGDGLVYIQISDIVHIDGSGSYSTFFLINGQKHIVSKNLKEYEDILPSQRFFRCHNSHIINLDYVHKFTRSEGYFVKMKDDSTIEISRRKKEEFLKRME